MRRGAGAGKAGRENKVRTYNWGQQRVSDHRSGVDLRNLDDVMEGGEALERIMQSVRAWMAEQEVLGLVGRGGRKGKPEPVDCLNFVQMIPTAKCEVYFDHPKVKERSFSSDSISPILKPHRLPY